VHREFLELMQAQSDRSLGSTLTSSSHEPELARSRLSVAAVSSASGPGPVAAR
jgi:hypothetical protein